MSLMFKEAYSFEQDIRVWEVDTETKVNNMFKDATQMLSKYGDDINDGTPNTDFFKQTP